MKIVIDIDEKDYKRIKEIPEIFDSLTSRAYKVIREGTPLPIGHGGLIDVDYLREDFKASKKISFAERMDISCIVDHAPIVVEADKEATKSDIDFPQAKDIEPTVRGFVETIDIIDDIGKKVGE